MLFLFSSIAIYPGTFTHRSGVGLHSVSQLVKGCPAVPKTSQGKKGGQVQPVYLMKQFPTVVKI